MNAFSPTEAPGSSMTMMCSWGREKVGVSQEGASEAACGASSAAAGGGSPGLFA